MSLPVPALLRLGVVTLAGAGLVLAATQVEGAVALGPRAKPGAATASASRPVTTASVLCPGPELVGVPGVDDVPVSASVVAATAPAELVDPTAGTGALSLEAMPGGSLASASTRGQSAQALVGKATGVRATASGALAPGLVASQSWLVASGDRRSLVSAPCGSSGSDFWILAGGGDPGRQERLVLTNPGGNPVSVDVTLHGPEGSVRSGAGAGIVVPAHGRTAFLVDSIAGDVASPAVHVVARGGVVGAVLNDLFLDGVRAAGSDDATPAAPPSKDQVVTGVAIGGKATLRVAVPGTSEAVVQARLLTATGPRALPKGSVVRIQGGAVQDIDLSAVAPGAYAVQVRADQPVVAGVLADRTTAGHPGDFAWSPSTSPIAGVAGLPLASPAGAGKLGVSHQVVLSSSGDTAVVDVVTVDAAGTARTNQVDVGTDAAVAVQLDAAVSVWVHRAAGAGQVRAGLVTWTKDADGTLLTATPLRDAALRSTTVSVLPAPTP